jgi:hypothetical protein
MAQVSYVITKFRLEPATFNFTVDDRGNKFFRNVCNHVSAYTPSSTPQNLYSKAIPVTGSRGSHIF